MTGSLLITNARILTLAGPDRPRRGIAMRELSPINHGSVLLRDGKIVEVGPSVSTDADRVIDAGGRVLMPAFVD